MSTTSLVEPAPGGGDRKSRIFSWIVITALSFLLYGLLLYEELELDKSLFRLTQFAYEKYYVNLQSITGIIGDDLYQHLSGMLSLVSEDAFDEINAPGTLMKNQGVSAHFPVLMVPGVISTSLELWEGHPCSRKFFRQRFWGTLSMLRIMLVDKDCWLKHMRLDPETGRDPPNVKLRAAQGIEAADFLFPGFWVWARIIENLSLIGYDHNNMMMAPYDWRMDFEALEERDKYFSRMKANIEMLFKVHNKKVVMLCHSLGAMVWLYFMKWVEADPKLTGGVGGNGGPEWIDKHIESFINIGGPLLGLPKSISCLISGEMKDTAQMGRLETYILESMLSRRERLSMFRTWVGPISMLPKGGDLVWKSAYKGQQYSLLNLSDNKSWPSFPQRNTVDDVQSLMKLFLPSTIRDKMIRLYSEGIASPAEIPQNQNDPKKWTNPLEVSLPNAPDMKIYCLYGFKKSTELGYVYKVVHDDPESLVQSGNVSSALIEDMAVPIIINQAAVDASSDLLTGVIHGDGDGSVPLLSLGFMGRKAWTRWSHLNPFNIKVVTREYEHEPTMTLKDIRGGPKTGDHVDILGNHELTIDIIKIVSNYRFTQSNGTDLLQDRIMSDIDKMSEDAHQRIQSKLFQQV